MHANKWGNSIGIRLPREFVEYTQITDKSVVVVSIEGNRILIEKRPDVTPYKSIEELFEGFEGKYEPVSIDWGKPVGDEVW
jgi:antitoxin MazE